MYYHVWFVTKYRKPILIDATAKDIRRIFDECIQRHNYKVLELETNRDHVHMLVEVEDRKHLSEIVRILKAVSAKEILRTPHFRVGNTRNPKNGGYHTRKRVEEQEYSPKRAFWARRFGYKEIWQEGLPAIKEYIRDQKNERKT